MARGGTLSPRTRSFRSVVGSVLQLYGDFRGVGTDTNTTRRDGNSTNATRRCERIAIPQWSPSEQKSLRHVTRVCCSGDGIRAIRRPRVIKNISNKRNVIKRLWLFLIIYKGRKKCNTHARTHATSITTLTRESRRRHKVSIIKLPRQSYRPGSDSLIYVRTYVHADTRISPSVSACVLHNRPAVYTHVRGRRRRRRAGSVRPGRNPTTMSCVCTSLIFAAKYSDYTRVCRRTTGKQNTARWPNEIIFCFFISVFFFDTGRFVRDRDVGSIYTRVLRCSDFVAIKTAPDHISNHALSTRTLTTFHFSLNFSFKLNSHLFKKIKKYNFFIIANNRSCIYNKINIYNYRYVAVIFS